MNTLFLILVVAATVGSGGMFGLFFAFSNFVMKAFFKIPANYGNAAMQAVNVSIINPWFLILFMGTAVCSLVLVVQSVVNWGEPGTAWILTGSMLYLLGCMVVTICFNVPLNNELAEIDPEHTQSVSKWHGYFARWMPWNHVRTFSTLASTVGFAIGLISVR